MIEAKVATLYAEMEVRTSKLDRELDRIKSMMGALKLPKLDVQVDTSAATRQVKALTDQLAALQKAAAGSFSARGAKAAASAAAATKVAAPTDPAFAKGAFVPLAGLQAAGLKFQERMQAAADKVADKIKAANDRIDAAHRRAQEKAVAEIRRASAAREKAFEAIMAQRAREASRGAEIVDTTRVFDDVPGKTFDPDRAAAKSRLGLGVLNMAQDTIQGGSPAFAINNVLGMAQDKGIKSLVGDAVAAAGGVGTLAKALGFVGITAGAAFMVIDNGLKKSKLEWSDFGSVVANTAPMTTAADAIKGIGVAYESFSKTAIGSPVDAFFKSIGDTLSSWTGTLADATLGWSGATAAAKAHKDEVEGMVRAAREYNQAVKELARFKSPEQERKEGMGEDVGKELAKLGGDDGIAGLADRLAKQATQRDGDRKVKITEVGEDGKEKEVEITRREQMRRRFQADLNAATKLDPNAVGRVMAGLKGANLPTEGLAEALKRPDDRVSAERKFEDEEADYESFRQDQENAYQSKLEESQGKASEKQQEDQGERFWAGLERGAAKFEAEVEAAKQSQSFRLPGGIGGVGLGAAELEAKRQNDLAVAQAEMFRAPELRVASSGFEFEKNFQADINAGSPADEDNRKNNAITAEKVTEMLELLKKGGGPLSAGARALLGPA